MWRKWYPGNGVHENNKKDGTEDGPLGDTRGGGVGRGCGSLKHDSLLVTGGIIGVPS